MWQIIYRQVFDLYIKKNVYQHFKYFFQIIATDLQIFYLKSHKELKILRNTY